MNYNAPHPYNSTFPYNYTNILDQYLDPSAVISLYQADLTNLPGGSILYFANEKNEKLSDIVWQGITYTAIPIEVKGFETRGGGQFPRPILKLSNYAGVVGGLAKQFNDLVGVKFTRKRTRAKYLDAVNFTAGNSNADPNTFYPDDIYYINRKISESRYYVEWELTSALDISGVKLPRRQIIQNMCTWRYRRWTGTAWDYTGVSECSYTGEIYANILDATTIGGTPTTPAQDVCGKRLSSCKLRFPGVNAVLPYGGFPGAGMI